MMIQNLVSSRDLPKYRRYNMTIREYLDLLKTVDIDEVKRGDRS